MVITSLVLTIVGCSKKDETTSKSEEEKRLQQVQHMTKLRRNQPQKPIMNGTKTAAQVAKESKAKYQDFLE